MKKYIIVALPSFYVSQIYVIDVSGELCKNFALAKKFDTPDEANEYLVEKDKFGLFTIMEVLILN